VSPMTSHASCEANRAQLRASFEGIFDQLYEWREQHPEASLDEIARQVGPRRRQLIGEWIAQLACQHGDGTVVAGMCCPRCGGRLIYKGKSAIRQEHLEGEIELKRASYYCPACEEGFFPP
jgi:hypothetical protein